MLITWDVYYYLLPLSLSRSRRAINPLDRISIISEKSRRRGTECARERKKMMMKKKKMAPQRHYCARELRRDAASIK